jgi:glucosamine kinase
MTNFLIADSGSTKTQWILVLDRKKSKSFTTVGINPFYMNKEDIIDTTKKAKDFLLADNGLSINGCLDSLEVFFYGAGATLHKRDIIADALHQVYCTDKIFVDSDLLGAARALCKNEPGIACILGTGSNSCYYNGKTIESHVSPLGYVLGDEGSGAAIGKRLISDILKGQLPPMLVQGFFHYYNLTSSDILEAVYRKPLPNRYLAQFVKFIDENIHIKELENIVVKSFDDFILRNILQYEQAKTNYIHFTGSIAFGFSKQLVYCLDKHQLKLGKISKGPIDDLVLYHVQNHIIEKI